MKLLVVTPYFYPKIGGLENYAYQMCRALKNKFGWDIVIVTSNHNSNKLVKEKFEGLTIYRLPILWKVSNTPINPFWYFQIKKIIRDEKPNLINAHTPVPFIADITALVCGNIPLVVTYHAFTLYKYNAVLFNLFIRIYKAFEYMLFRKANKILLVSDAIKEAIPERFQNKVVVINNSLSQREIPLARKSKNQNTDTLVFIGSLDKSHEWKGLRELLLAIKLLSDQTKTTISLLVIGDGDNKSTYQKLAKKYAIEKQVQFVGKKEGKDKKKILDKATIGVLYPKSSNDAFPTVLLEYWAHSLAVITANITPVNKIIADKKTAYAVEHNNPVALAHAIEHLTTHKTLTETIARKGYRELRQKYLLENEVEKFQALANSL